VSTAAAGELVDLSTATPIWERFFLVAPLVLVATKEGDGYNVAPKHLAGPLGWENWFAFVCSPGHATFRNLAAHPEFTVSFPGEKLILETSLAAAAREPDSSKPSLAAVPTIPARTVDGVLVERCNLYLECELDRVVDGFGDGKLVVGRIVAASAPRSALRGPDVDDADLLQALRPLVYLAPGRFAVVETTHGFPHPAGFSR
jgi:flavin reductase (DIM6/NTAB) family NADH-FMN oxidoreductase RutF